MPKHMIKTIIQTIKPKEYMMTKPILLAIVCAMLTLAGCASNSTQPAENTIPPLPEDAATRLATLNVVMSPGTIDLYYTAGYDQDAFTTRSLLEEARRFYEEQLGTEFEFDLAWLGREHWEAVTQAPYGFPHPSADLRMVFLPAEQDIPVIDDYLARKAAADPDLIALLESTGLSYEEISRHMVALIGIHELGHIYTHAAGIRTHTRWMSEFMANYFTSWYLQNEDMANALIWENMARIVVQGEPPAHTSIADFERIYVGVGVPNYHWYQSMFTVKAADIVAKDGHAFITALQEAFPRVHNMAPLPPDEFADQLESVRPGFRTWLAGFGDQTTSQVSIH
jgi:hypothetical protein